MKIKKLIFAGAAALFVSGATWADTLTLATQNEDSTVTVQCNGQNGPEPLPANGSITMHWWEISMWFGFKTNLECTFTESNSNKQIGTANLSIKNDFSQATIASEKSIYQTKIDPADATSNYVDNITVTLIKNS